MHMSRSYLLKQTFLAGIMAVSLGILPACAAEEGSLGELTIPAAPQTDNNGAVPSVPAASIAPSDAALATNGSVDALANFGPSSGTVVGNRSLELRDEVLRLRSSVNLNSNQFAILRSSGAAGAVQYHSTVAAITARLQNGTTKGNPILLRQWDEANSSLDEVTSSLNRLNSLLTAIDSDASVASYLQQSIEAGFELSGAVDEDHDQLKLLRDEVSRQIVQLDYLRTQTTSDIQRQTTYLTTERSNLQALAFAISRGELMGNSLANRPVIVSPPPAMPMSGMMGGDMPYTRAAPTTPVMPGTLGNATPMSPRDMMAEKTAAAQQAIPAAPTSPLGRLLVLIRYNQPTVEYEQQLSQAVGSMIEHHPNSEFSIVAVSPASGDSTDLAKTQEAAKRNAEDVKRSLIQLGLSPSRITLANTQTQTAQVPEVHVYVR